MSLHRACCCDPETGECGMEGAVRLCAASGANGLVTTRGFFPWRIASFSGTNSQTSVSFSGSVDEGVTTSQGRFGAHISFGDRAVSDAEVINESGLASFASVSFPSNLVYVNGNGQQYRVRSFIAQTTTFVQNGGAPTPSTSPVISLFGTYRWQFRSVLQMPGGSPVCNGVYVNDSNPAQTITYTRSDSGSTTNYTGFYRSETVRSTGAVGSLEQSHTQTVGRVRGILDLPSNWDGPDDFDPCGGSSPFVRNTSAATTPCNDAAIQAALLNDPLRTCRGCGQ